MAKWTLTILLMISALFSVSKIIGEAGPEVGPEVIKVPQSTETIESGTAIFTCTVNRPHLDIDWLIRSKDSNNIIHHVVIYDAIIPGTVIIPEALAPLSHGDYSAASDISGDLHSYNSSYYECNK